jgi:molybdenum cofactor cytidylyltransferase
MKAPVHILILAAGASRRMQGQDKLLAMVDDLPLLRRLTILALATGAPVTVALSPAFPARQSVLQDLPCQIAHVPGAHLGMSASLRRGVISIRAGYPAPMTGVMVLPADMPLFTTPALRSMIDQFVLCPTRILRGCSDTGQPGHPAIFPSDLWDALADITGDEGGRSVLAATTSRIDLFPLPGQMAILDLDTPEDWTAFRSLHRH